MSSTPSPEALLFDLGGVVMSIDWDRAFARWAADSGERVETLRSRYRFDAKAKDRIPVYAFSNSNAAHHAVWSLRFAEALAHFRRVFVSSDLGLRKPERAAFEAIVREPQDVERALRPWLAAT